MECVNLLSSVFQFSLEIDTPKSEVTCVDVYMKYKGYKKGY